jgi:hypothetical protein
MIDRSFLSARHDGIDFHFTGLIFAGNVRNHVEIREIIMLISGVVAREKPRGGRVASRWETAGKEIV